MSADKARNGCGLISNLARAISTVSAGPAGPTRLTAVNADMLQGKTLGEQEEIWFEAEDGSMAHGWIVGRLILILSEIPDDFRDSWWPVCHVSGPL